MVTVRRFAHLPAVFSGVIVLFLLAGLVLHYVGGAQAESFRVDEGCDLRVSSCRATTVGGKSVRLTISPDGIPLLQPLTVTVELGGIDASSVEVVFRGVDVDMGRLAYPLSSNDRRKFTGGASLSVCTQRRMSWEASVVITERERRYAVPFRFDTEYRSQFKLI